MDDAFCNAHPAITINDDIRRLFDDIVAICAEKDIKNPALVKDTLNLIDSFRADIPDILSKPGNFENGFFNFLRSQESIKLQESELDNAYDYIKKNLESTVGYWSESEVAIALKDWRIAENEAIEDERRRQEDEERRRQEEEERKKQEEELKRLEEEARQAKDKAKQELKGNLTALSKKKVSARELIDNASRDMLHNILDEVINLDYEFIVDKILEHQN